jgi:hypothetical protein
MPSDPFSGRRQQDTPRGTFHELRSKRLFQCRDSTRQSRLAGADDRRGIAEVKRVGDRREGPELGNRRCASTDNYSLSNDQEHSISLINENMAR